MNPSTRPGCLVLLSFLVLALTPQPTFAQGDAIQKFYGHYVGEAVSDAEGDIDTRDIRAEILARDKGFTVNWVMVIKKATGRAKRADSSIQFLPSPRAGIYTSAMRVDVFGNSVPLDPMKGDPYVWARVDGSTLTIHALIVTDSGGYEMQVYERTLAPGGMSLKFARVVDGQVLRTVTGALKKVK